MRANVLIQNIRDKVPYDEDDVEFHDLRAIHQAIRRAQEFLTKDFIKTLDAFC